MTLKVFENTATSRWAAYTGEPVFLEQVVCVASSEPATVEGMLGADLPYQHHDRVGIAWYGIEPAPDVLAELRPTSSEAARRSMIARLRSDLFLAHVVPARDTPSNRNNRHPFSHGRWTFMLNGQIGLRERNRSDVDFMIPAAYHQHRSGSTGSEALFLMALAEGLDADPKRALERAIARIMLISHAKGNRPQIQLAAALSDGQNLYSVRYATEGYAPSLYHRWLPETKGYVLASEPVGVCLEDWTDVDTGTFCTFDGRSAKVEHFQPYGLAAVA